MIGTRRDGRGYARVAGRAGLLEIWLHIADDQPIHAGGFLDRLDIAAPRLAAFTEIGTDRLELGEGLRSFPVERYMLYYRNRLDGIEVVRMLHASRDITPLF